MTFEEFVRFREVQIRDLTHERIVRLFFSYLASVSGEGRRLPELVGGLLDIDLSKANATTGCFGGMPEGEVAPYENVDFYIRFDSDIRVFVYGAVPCVELKLLGEDEYVLFVLGNELSSSAESGSAGHFCLL